MKRWISGLLAAATALAMAPAALAEEVGGTDIEYSESAQLEFDFILHNNDGEAKRSDVDIRVTSSSFLDAYERSVSLTGNVLSVTVTADPTEILAVREKTGFVKVSVRVPRSYDQVETQSQTVTVTYPEMDLDSFEDTLYDMRDYGDKEATFSPDTLALPARAMTLMKKYLKSDATMTLEYDGFSLVFVGRYVKSMDAKTIGTNPKTDPSSRLNSLLATNKINKSKLDILRFGAGELGGQLGVAVHTGSRKNYVYQYNTRAEELEPIESSTENGVVTFFVRNLGEFVISPTEIDVENLDAPRADADDDDSTTGKKLVLIGSQKKGTSSTGKRLVLSGSSAKEEKGTSGRLTLR